MVGHEEIQTIEKICINIKEHEKAPYQLRGKDSDPRQSMLSITRQGDGAPPKDWDEFLVI